MRLVVWPLRKEKLRAGRGTETKRGKYFKRKSIVSCISAAEMANMLDKDQVDLAIRRSL